MGRASGNTSAGMTSPGTASAAGRGGGEGGFDHDGRFATLGDVVDHYNQFYGTNLSGGQKADLVEYLKSR